METRFDFKKVESKLYQEWEERGFFSPEKQPNINKELKGEAARFSMVMPPPNVTGTLHMGHGSVLSIEDLFTRYARMQGRKTLYLPGTDHAAIATQTKVEKKLLEEQGKSRHDLGREKFLKEIEVFVQESKDTIHNQIRRMGTSCDWSKEAYTMDEIRTKLVKTVFKMMYEDGLIYRGKRIVNWCPRCGSTLADDEVEYEEEKGKLYWLKYGPFVLATARPETKLGDTAVAVYPGDERYKDMVGKKYKIPGVLGEFEVEVVEDRAVDKEFGSGAIKVTPAHSFIDNEIAERHNLPLKQIINKQGRMMKNCGKYAGLTVKEAREAIVKDMEAMGLIDHIDENYVHNIGKCYRCGEQIEPLLSKQWFVSVSKKVLKDEKTGKKISLKERALQAVRDGETKIIPGRFNKTYDAWLTNLRDWCISRQIWFGHRIPVWYCEDCGEIMVEVETPKECQKCKSKKLEQDPDTLDTWFSSGTWTFSTFYQNEEEIKINKDGKLEKNDFLREYHPTSVLETAYDIIFFWVARMMLLTTYAVGEVPFRTVYFHGLVRDKSGRKMSKSLGNGIDPLDMIDKYGADATRLAILIGNTPGNDLKIYEEKVQGYQKFVTKLYNIGRFIKAQMDDKDLKAKPELTAVDNFIITRFRKLVTEVTEDLNQYHFSRAGRKLNDFTWGELADWYLEAAKVEGNKGAILKAIFEDLLKLWHPFIPFVTEDLYREISDKKDGMLIVANWPKEDDLEFQENAEMAARFEILADVVAQIRKLRSIYKLASHVELKLKAVLKNAEAENFLASQSLLLERLSGATLDEEENLKRAKNKLSLPFSKGVLMIAFPDDFDIEKAKQELQKEVERIKAQIKGAEQKLANESFVAKAPPEIVEAEQKKIKSQQKKLSWLEINEK